MGTRLRLFSGNLLNGGADPQALADLVSDNQIDVAAVQEMDHHQAEALSLVLPHGQLEPATDFTGMGIALRQPAEIDRVSLIHRNAHIARLSPREWPELDRPIEVMSVHITAPHSFPIWKQLARRRAQMRGLLDYLKASPERPRAVVGDFNASPLWPVYRRMAGVLEDLALTHANRTGQKPAPTWPATGRIARRLLRIDHCFGHAVEVLDLQVIEIPGSDHDGLLIDLSVSAA